jgi:DNA-binding response OmpR family regulator
VAEDDEAMRNVVVETLRKDGYAVSEASDGGRLLVTFVREFMHSPRVELIDLLVSDIRMPVCSGLEILEQLRAAKWPVPVILMTAFGDDHIRARARLLGALVFDKPFKMHDLRVAAARLVRRVP